MLIKRGMEALNIVTDTLLIVAENTVAEVGDLLKMTNGQICLVESITTSGLVLVSGIQNEAC